MRKPISQQMSFGVPETSLGVELRRSRAGSQRETAMAVFLPSFVEGYRPDATTLIKLNQDFERIESAAATGSWLSKLLKFRSTTLKPDPFAKGNSTSRWLGVLLGLE